MSACISREGEYSDHVPADDFICSRCGAVDEYAVAEAAALLNKIRALAAEHAACSGCPTPWWLTQVLGQS